MRTPEIAAFLDLTPRRLQQLASENVVPGPANGEWDLATVTREYIRYLRSRRVANGNDDLRREQTRLAKESADAKALENEKSRGRLLDADEVYKFYESIFVTFRQKTLASTMTDNEKDELLNDLRGLKTRME